MIMFDHDSRSRHYADDPAYAELIRSGKVRPATDDDAPTTPPAADIGKRFGYSAPMPPPMKTKPRRVRRKLERK